MLGSGCGFSATKMKGDLVNLTHSKSGNSTPALPFPIEPKTTVVSILDRLSTLDGLHRFLCHLETSWGVYRYLKRTISEYRIAGSSLHIWLLGSDKVFAFLQRLGLEDHVRSPIGCTIWMVKSRECDFNIALWDSDVVVMADNFLKMSPKFLMVAWKRQSGYSIDHLFLWLIDRKKTCWADLLVWHPSRFQSLRCRPCPLCHLADPHESKVYRWEKKELDQGSDIANFEFYMF